MSGHVHHHPVAQETLVGPRRPARRPFVYHQRDIQLFQGRVERIVVGIVQVAAVYHVGPDVRRYHRVLFHRPIDLDHRLLHVMNRRSRHALQPRTVYRAEVREPIVVAPAYGRRQLGVEAVGFGRGKAQYRGRRIESCDVYPLGIQGQHL